jgi:acyl-homoserine-lactone acylase
MGVDLTPACSALAGWDGLFDANSTGALVWRELLATFSYKDQTDAGSLYALPFDPTQPLTTPSGLAPAPATGTDPILAALATASTMLTQAGLAPATPLGQAQFAMKGSLVIPIHGGNPSDGTANVVIFDTGFNSDTGFNTTLLPGVTEKTVINPATQLAPGGYLVNFGTSFVMAMEFAASGPQAEAMLSYSESSDPSSPHYADQTQLFSKKGWRPILFTDAQIAADPNLVTTQVTGGP